MARKKHRSNLERRRKDDSRNSQTKVEAREENVEVRISTSTIEDQVAESASAVACAEDQANINNVFNTLHVTPDKTTEPVDRPVPVEDSEEEHRKVVVKEDANVEQAESENEGNQEDGASCKATSVASGSKTTVEKTTERPSDKKAVDTESELELGRDAPVSTSFMLERKDSEVTYDRHIFNVAFGNKFTGFLNFIDPEFRFAADVGPAETFDSEGVKAILEKMQEKGIHCSWPFETSISSSFDLTPNMLKDLYQEILEQLKFCLMLACAERGYDFTGLKRNAKLISRVWGKNIFPIEEAKTIVAIVNEMKDKMTSIGSENDEARFWSEMRNYSEVLIPALETFDSKTLSENNIVDCMATLNGRKELGFDVTEEEVDQMLETMDENEFCEFVATALNYPDVFTTPKQIKLIFPHLEKMSKLMDIRVKQAGIKIICHIFTVISPEQSMKLIEEMKDERKWPMKVFGIDSEHFEPLRGGEPKRSNYFNIFCSSLQKEESDFISVKEFSAALACFYLVFPAFEVNTIIYKILCLRHEGEKFKAFSLDRQLLFNALLSLPFQLRERLEIGDEFSKGEVTDNVDSIYFQVKSSLRNAQKSEQEFTNNLDCFMQFESGSQPLVSIERILRMLMKCVEDREHMSKAAKGISLLRRTHYRYCNLPKELFQDLLVLALSKYTVPEEKCNGAKYEFIDSIIEIVQDFKENGHIQIDELSVKEKWTNLSHHWFSILYLSSKYPILKTVMPDVRYPWESNDVWNEDNKGNKEENPKKYAILAKVSTAWPECSSIDVVTNVVSDHVPRYINRFDLYQEMRCYFSELTAISDYCKNKLLSQYDEKIKFLKKPSEPLKGVEKKKKTEDEQHRDGYETDKKARESNENKENELLEEDDSWFQTKYSQEEWVLIPKRIKDAIRVRRRRVLRENTTLE